MTENKKKKSKSNKNTRNKVKKQEEEIPDPTQSVNVSTSQIKASNVMSPYGMQMIMPMMAPNIMNYPQIGFPQMHNPNNLIDLSHYNIALIPKHNFN